MSEKEIKHSKYYYEYDRNLDNAKQNSTYPNWENVSPTRKNIKEEKDHSLVGSLVKESEIFAYLEHGIDKDDRVPEYYRGKNGYEARKVCDNFDLSYHLGTATTYILRAYHKHDTPVDCLKKAIAHLEFELEKINETDR